MTAPLILHHYDESPYAEKIRLMLGFTGLKWQSLIAPIQPPRPHLDELTGGYRRIPVAQMGADVFCDTAIITQEIVALSGEKRLDVNAMDQDALALMQEAEREIFFAAIASVSPLKLLTTLLVGMGPVGMFRFVADRVRLMKGASVRPAQGAQAKVLFARHLDTLEVRLAHQAWVTGDEPTLADFAVYHPLWLNMSCSRSGPPGGPRVRDWFERMTRIGHGHREEIDVDAAWSAARSVEPRPLPAHNADSEFAVGRRVQVAPTDYGVVAVTGELACVNDERIVLRRVTSALGAVHVHFPRQGYALSATP